MKTLLSNLSDDPDQFHDCLNKFVLIFEHFQCLLILLDYKVDEDHISILSSKTTKAELSGIANDIFTCTSGIACFRNIFYGLANIFPRKLKFGIDEKSYYEIIESYGNIEKCHREYNINILSLMEYKKINKIEEYDGFCTDIYPNRIVKQSVFRIPIEEIIKCSLEKRAQSASSHNNSSPESPLIFVIDCATIFFTHPEVSGLIERIQSDIQSGNLILILTNSLAKYAMGGSVTKE